MKTLIIAEKPSVGRDIARVVGAAKRGEGYLHGDNYIVSWAIGHLATLKEPEDYNEHHKKWRMADLPIIPTQMGLKPMPKTQKQLTLIKKMMDSKEVGDIICATDSGREGELIFRYIYEWANCEKPVKRLWISSLTDAAIKKGLSTMRDGSEYDKLYASARCRAEADWLVGMNATRAFTLKHNDLLPMGRVQTPTLALLAARQQEIDAFVAQNYWEVVATFLTANGETYAGTWIDAEGETKILKQEEAEAIKEKILGDAQVASVEKEEKRQSPPQLFDLTELQREANRKLGLSAKATLDVAQSLYEKHKLITYPRTDSRYISDDMQPQLNPTISALQTISAYQSHADYLLGLSELPITKRIVNDAKVTDHHAIIPTGIKKMPALNANEAAVYDLIVRQFLAAFFPAYVYEVTTIITEAKGERFQSKGRVEKNAGWTAVIRDTSTDTPLPAVQKGEAVTATEAEVLHKKTQPPKPYTEATLLSAMENAGRFVEDEALKEALKASGLGTPATRAAMIEKLIASGYVERRKKALAPTEKGLRLITLVPPELRSPETTGKWERALSRIADGEMEPTRFMDSIKRYVRYLIDCAAKRNATI